MATAEDCRGSNHSGDRGGSTIFVIATVLLFISPSEKSCRRVRCRATPVPDGGVTTAQPAPSGLLSVTQM